jgi:hypothetical protein
MVTATLLGVDETEPVTLLDADPAEGSNVLHVPAPPSAGRWYLELTLRFTDGRGDATGYARVIVPRG